jgi:hypothetical protein
MVEGMLEDGLRMVERLLYMLRLVGAWLQDGQRWLYDGWKIV